MLTGEVQWYDKSKSHGYIENGRNRIYIHESQLQNCIFLRKGESVQFNLVAGDHGLEAVNVNLVILHNTRKARQPGVYQFLFN